MRLLCPFCQKAISVPDSEAGRAVNCPECGQQFAAPQLYTPSPAAFETVSSAKAAPVPPPVHETYVTAPTAASDLKPVSLDRGMFGYAHMRSIPLDPRVIRFIPAAALTLVFLLTFFKWDGMYPAGYAAYTQNAWQCLFASISNDPVAEEELKMLAELEKIIHSSWWLLFFLLLLFPALALAWAGPIVDLVKIKLPPSIEPHWKYRPAALGVLVVMMLLFFMAQWASGLGLQRAVDARIDEMYAAEKEKAKTPEAEQRLEMKVAIAKGGSLVRTTPWMRLTFLLQLLAALAVVAEAGLALRGDKPAPRAAVMW